MSPRIRILGLGNVLAGDDGFGPAVALALQACYDWPDDVEVVDVGTPGLDLVPFVSRLEVAVFVDTVRSEGSPGEIRVYDKAQLLRHAPPARVSPHDPGVKETLLALEFAGDAPRDVVVVGAIPGPVRLEPGLSAPLRDAVPAAMEAVVAALRPFGVAPRPRALEAPVVPWWEVEAIWPPRRR